MEILLSFLNVVIAAAIIQFPLTQMFIGLDLLTRIAILLIGWVYQLNLPAENIRLV